MRQTKHFETKEGISELMLFLDGDTVVLVLNASSDHYFFSDRLLQSISEMGDDGIQTMLIDCEALQSPGDIDIKRFVKMERIISKQGIRLLMLDATAEVRRRFEAMLPKAVWIDSNESGYFGQQLKERVRRST